MKTFLTALLALLPLVGYAAAPSPPQNAAIAGFPNQGVWVTNITWIYTNVAVKTPTTFIPQVTIYNGTNGLHGGTVLSWDNNPSSPDIAGSRLYYGSTLGSTTNVVTVGPAITTVVFFNVFTNKTEMYWAWVTAFNTSGLESANSDGILFGGR